MCGKSPRKSLIEKFYRDGGRRLEEGGGTEPTVNMQSPTCSCCRTNLSSEGAAALAVAEVPPESSASLAAGTVAKQMRRWCHPENAA